MSNISHETESRDYFSHVPPSPRPIMSGAYGDSGSKGHQQRAPVAFTSPDFHVRPHPTSRMSTHRLDTSTTNFAEVLDDNGGPDGLQKLDVDYFNTVLDIFRDRKQHHSPVVFDFMLLHEINIHHLEHQLIAEWDWLSCALNQDEQQLASGHFATQAPRRLEEIRFLLHKYSTALRDFEEMRKRATLDERANPLSHSSWHEKLLRLEGRIPKSPGHLHQENERMNPLRRISNAIQAVTMSKDDPERHAADILRKHTNESLKHGHASFTTSTIPEAAEVEPEIRSEKPAPKRKLFGTASPACRQLAGVEDWLRERSLRDLSATAAQKQLRDEALARRFKRFTLAFFAGISLIGPMLLMTLVGRLSCSLATTSVATGLFGLLVAWLTEVSDRDIVVVIAGYAAVLVVFVGTQH